MAMAITRVGSRKFMKILITLFCLLAWSASAQLVTLSTLQATNAALQAKIGNLLSNTPSFLAAGSNGGFTLGSGNGRFVAYDVAATTNFSLGPANNTNAFTINGLTGDIGVGTKINFSTNSPNGIFEVIPSQSGQSTNLGFNFLSYSSTNDDNTFNEILNLGYNAGGGGTRASAKDTALYYSTEGNYHVSGGEYAEAHLFYIDKSGSQHRLRTWTINKNNSNDWTKFETGSGFTWRDSQNDSNFFNIAPSQLNFYMSQYNYTNGLRINADSGTIFIQQPNTVGGGKGLSFNNWSSVLFPGIIFNNANSVEVITRLFVSGNSSSGATIPNLAIYDNSGDTASRNWSFRNASGDYGTMSVVSGSSSGGTPNTLPKLTYRQTGVVIPSTNSFQFSSTTSSEGTPDTALYRAGAGTVGSTNGFTSTISNAAPVTSITIASGATTLWTNPLSCSVLIGYSGGTLSGVGLAGSNAVFTIWPDPLTGGTIGVRAGHIVGFTNTVGTTLASWTPFP